MKIMKYYWPILIAFVLFPCQLESFAGENNDPGKRFSTVVTGVILDSQTGLMWSTKDNGADIDWEETEKFCAQFRAGGFQDWRMPTQKELESLYDPQEKNRFGFHITSQINLTTCCPWASDDSLNSAAIFSFRSGKRPWGFKSDTGELRALPVRDAKRPLP